MMITVVGCVIGSTVGATSGTTMPGVTLMAVGAVIYWIGSTKACPQCSKRVKHAALECTAAAIYPHGRKPIDVRTLDS